MNIGPIQPTPGVIPAFDAKRTARRRVARHVLLVSLSPWLGVGNAAWAQGPSPRGNDVSSPPLPKINPNGWTSPAVCGECHQAIHAVWRESMHAKAWSDAVFQASYHRAIEAYGKSRSRDCLLCHAPTVRQGPDLDEGNGAHTEGVTCDFCHSVTAVELGDASDPVRWSLGKTKYGPLRHAQSPAHKIIHSELHSRSEFCAACHEYKNANNVTVLGTYGEWKESAYAKKGKQCQDCHMPLVPGRVVALDVKKDAGKTVNLHNISGSHSMNRVREAVTLDLSGYEWFGDRIWVYIKVTNRGSGHCFPTGMPMHRAYLDVAIHDGAQVVGRREIPFEIVMLNKDARVITREHELMVEAASVRSDTRLRPNEVRTIDVSFRDVTATRLTLTAELHYEYSTETFVTDETGEHVEPVKMSFVVASRRSSMKRDGR